MRATRRFLSVQSNLKTNPVIQSAKQFQILLNGDGEAFATVDYENLNSNAYDLLHTLIPDEYQGQGLGTILGMRIFQHLANNNKQFKITCEFLQKVYEENGQKYARYVIEE